MALPPGTQLTGFEVSELIGVGGMGEVYRATDTKLGREVAIKVLPASFAEDANRLRRFEREAQLLASLTHPNIATLYDFQSTGEIHFLVMELVEGKTLSERLDAGAMSIEEAVPVFTEVAQAIDSAHLHRIVHRDLKPGNIKLTTDDHVKVLDFGLAKSYASDDASGATASSSADETTLSIPLPPSRDITATEMLVGTPSYMSPEQARGKLIDKRTDVWAFGCCLFEALTAKKVFDGDSAADRISSVTRDEPNWDGLPDETPAEIRRVLRGCLEKDPRRRLSSMNDIALALEQAGRTEQDQIETQFPRSGTIPVVGIGSSLVTYGVLVLVALGLGFWLRGIFTDAPSENSQVWGRPTKKVLTLQLPEEAPLHLLGTGKSLAISHDGRYVAYVAQVNGLQFLYLVDLTTGETQPVADTEDARDPFFSPDGKWIGFATAFELKKVPVASGVKSIRLTGVPPVSRGASWSPSGLVSYAPVPGASLAMIHDGREGVSQLTKLRMESGEVSHRWPQFCENGRYLLYTVVAGEDFQNADNSRIAFEEIGTRKRKIIVEGSRYARYATSGHVVFSRGTQLLARPVAEERAHSDANRVLDGVMSNESDGAAQFDISHEGTLVYVPGGVHVNTHLHELVWVDRTGQETSTGLPALGYGDPSISPDGDRLAVGIMQGDDHSIWIYDTSGNNPTRFLLTPDKGREFGARWSPDGTRVAYTFFHKGAPVIRMRSATGGGEAEHLYENPNGAAFPTSWSPDGKVLAFALDTFSTAGIQTPRGISDIWILPMDGSGEARPWKETPHLELSANFSPDGEWLAYLSDEEGKLNVYVEAYDQTGPRIKVSPNGGKEPRWNPDFPKTPELFYRDGRKMMVAELQLREELSVENVRPLFEGDYVSGEAGIEGNIEYAVSPNGDRFLFIKDVSPSAPPVTELRIIVNWFDELHTDE